MRILLLTLLTAASLSASELRYDVEFRGVPTREMTAFLKSVSELVILEEDPPPTIASLHRRAEADIPNLLRGLRSLGYYEARIAVEIDATAATPLAIVEVTPGPIYAFTRFKVVGSDIDPEALGIQIGRPAFPKAILDAERALLQMIACEGYPLAKVAKREVIADHEKKGVDVTLQLERGPRAYFGDLDISGQSRVSENFILKRIHWSPGEPYDPSKVDCTIQDLERTGLFYSVSLTPAKEALPDDTLPMTLELAESRHRTFGFGLSYSTEEYLGITGKWEHRNLRGVGERLTAKASASKRLQEGTLRYTIPDFLGNCDQDLIFLAEAEHENAKSFDDIATTFGALVDRTVNESIKISYGGTVKELHIRDSDNNKPATLLKIPFQLKVNSANNLLDPTFGTTVNVKIVPTMQVRSPTFSYLTQTFTTTAYQPLTDDKRVVFAARLTLGSILGASRRGIPPPERFFAGSENLLRGYAFQSISKEGGRSLFVTSFELRLRPTEKYGLVLFYDLGNVYSDPLPELRQDLLQSMGLGLRYHTPVGPLRLDIARPLNRRKGIDRSLYVYFSIGQAF